MKLVKGQKKEKKLKLKKLKIIQKICLTIVKKSKLKLGTEDTRN